MSLNLLLVVVYERSLEPFFGGERFDEHQLVHAHCEVTQRCETLNQRTHHVQHEAGLIKSLIHHGDFVDAGAVQLQVDRDLDCADHDDAEGHFLDSDLALIDADALGGVHKWAHLMHLPLPRRLLKS